MVFKFIKSQLIEVIEWSDDSDHTLAYHFPVENKEIKMWMGQNSKVLFHPRKLLL